MVCKSLGKKTQHIMRRLTYEKKLISFYQTWTTHLINFPRITRKNISLIFWLIFTCNTAMESSALRGINGDKRKGWGISFMITLLVFLRFTYFRHCTINGKELLNCDTWEVIVFMKLPQNYSTLRDVNFKSNTK